MNGYHIHTKKTYNIHTKKIKREEKAKLTQTKHRAPSPVLCDDLKGWEGAEWEGT